MELKTDYSDIKFAENGKLKLLIIVGTRPEIIRLAAVLRRDSRPHGPELRLQPQWRFLQRPEVERTRSVYGCRWR